MILGTAGHIDHGKTALVRALTGVDTDRLPEEKRRGITIDLGFAPLRLADDVVLGVVDVPGHEAFVRTMLAGASGIDLALLVIAADEGPMPQTREHLAILRLLHIPRIVVALTKCDLVDAEWLALVTEEVRELLSSTEFGGAEIVPTSVVSGQGLDMLRGTLLAHARVAPPKAVDDNFRLPVDRAFSMKGTGTVVTGTVWTGELAVDDTVRIMPLGTLARVRGLQTHGESIARIGPGMRAAVALAGIEPQAVSRGATLVASADWEASLVLRADLTILPGAPELRTRTKVRFHLATADVGARVVATGSPVTPVHSRPVRIVLDEPVLARAGDRFVLRSASPLATIGGGTITDPNATRRARPMPRPEMLPEERFHLFAAEAGMQGVRDAVLAVRLGHASSPPKNAVGHPASVVRIGDRWFLTDVLEGAREKLIALVAAHHAANPLATGAPRQDMRSRLGADVALFDHIVGDLVGATRLETVGAEVRLPGQGPALSDKQQKLTDDLLAALTAAGREPPSVTELEGRFGPHTLSLLRHLERQERVIQVEEARYYAPDAVRELLHRLEAGMAGKGELAPTDLRALLGFSRKYLIPFLEFCDKRGYTVRRGNGRVWRGGRAT